MMKYDYFLLSTQSVKFTVIKDKLIKLTDDGWEVLTTGNSFIILRRRMGVKRLLSDKFISKVIKKIIDPIYWQFILKQNRKKAKRKVNDE